MHSNSKKAYLTINDCYKVYFLYKKKRNVNLDNKMFFFCYDFVTISDKCPIIITIIIIIIITIVARVCFNYFSAVFKTRVYI